MIDSDRIISWAEERLGLKALGDYEHQQGRIALADALKELRIDTPSEATRATLTTVAAQSEYDLPDDCGIIDAVHWPDEWDDAIIFPATYDWILEIRRQVSSGTCDYDSTQPTTYAVYTRKGGQKKFALERASGIAAGLSILVDYFPFGYDEPDKGGEVDLPASLELALQYGTAWHLAEIYNAEKINYFLTNFERYKGLYWRRQTFQSNEQHVRPPMPF